MSVLNLNLNVGRPDVRYHCGDTIEFLPELKDNGKKILSGTLNYSVFCDDVHPVESGTLDLSQRSPVVAVSAKTPGFVQCHLSLRGSEPQLTAELGVAVSPEAIRPAMPRPDDFDEFWRANLSKLAAVPLEVSERPVTCDFAVMSDIRIKSLGVPVSGYFAKPVEYSGKLPVLIQFQGAGVKSAFPDVPLLWAARGFMALCINAHGLPNGEPSEFYDDLSRGGLSNYQLRGWEHRDTCYMLGMFLRVKRAVDFMTARPEWDGRNLFLMGHSQGAYQAIAGSYLDSRVSALAAGVPAGCDLCGAAAGRCEGWPKITQAGKNPDRDLQKIMATAPYFDNANFLAAVKCPAVFSVGWIDKSCRPTTVYAAINNCSSADKLILDRPGMGHASPGDIRSGFAGFLADRLRN